MELQTRALYNLIYFNLLQDKPMQCEYWQKEDYRSLSNELLFKGIESLGFTFSKEELLTFIRDADSPEALTEFFIEEKGDPALFDPLYLYLFEIWRRYYPQKKTLSLFCDELDHLIYLYDNHLLESDEPLQDDLENLKIILEDSIDEGQSPKKAWKLINQYCAHNLSSFLYDYISELIDSGHEKYGLDLLEGFSPFSDMERWFHFLQIRCCEHEDEKEEFSSLISQLLKHPDFELQVEVLDYMIDLPYNDLFLTLFSKTLLQVKNKEELLELIDIASDYFADNDEKFDCLKALEKEVEECNAKSIDEFVKTFIQLLK